MTPDMRQRARIVGVLLFMAGLTLAGSVALRWTP